jgi:hypothetical protein
MNARIQKEAKRLGLGIRPGGKYVRGGWTDGMPGKWVFSTYPLDPSGNEKEEDMGHCDDNAEDAIEQLGKDAEYFFANVTTHAPGANEKPLK